MDGILDLKLLAMEHCRSESHHLSHSPAVQGNAGRRWLFRAHMKVSNPRYFQSQPPSKLSETPASSAVPRNCHLSAGVDF